MRFYICVAFAMFALACGAGCVASARQPTVDPANQPPDALRYETISDLGGEVTVWEVKGSFIVKRFNNTDNRYSDQQSILMRRRPAAAEWAHFWQAVAPLRLWEWKRSYDSFQLPERIIISDGSCWALTCRRGSLRVQASGCNVSPKLGQPQITTLEGETVARLEQALDHLIIPPPPKPRT